MSNLPSDWQTKSLKDVVKLNYGKSPNGVKSSSGTFPLMGTGGISGYAVEALHSKPSIIVGRKGSIEHTMFVDIPFWAIDTTYYTSDEQCDINWLSYFFQNINLRKLNESTGVPSLNRDNLYTLELKTPPLPEQKKIAAILSSVDEAINATQAVIDQTRKVKEGLLQDLLTRGIGHTRFKQTEIGEIPEGWEVVRLGTVCHKITDGSHQAVKTCEDGSYPFLYVSSIRDGNIDFSNAGKISETTYNEISPGREPYNGVVLYTAVGSYGNAATVRTTEKFSFQRHIAYIQPQTKKLEPDFLELWLNSLSGKNYADKVAVGNAQKTITLNELSKYVIPLPRLEEQKSIIRHTQSLNKSAQSSQLRLDALRETKRGLMQDLLSGEVRVAV
jgi:type I restriction enzyme S subunit